MAKRGPKKKKAIVETPKKPVKIQRLVSLRNVERRLSEGWKEIEKKPTGEVLMEKRG